MRPVNPPEGSGAPAGASGASGSEPQWPSNPGHKPDKLDRALARAAVPFLYCSVQECENTVYKDGLCASCHATAATVRADFERYKRTGQRPSYVKDKPCEEER